MTLDYSALYIGGSWTPPAGTDRLPVISPSTEETIGSVPLGAPEDVDRAVASARAAFADPAGWASWTAAVRAEVLNRFADELLARAGDTAQRVASQNGMPVAFAREIEGGFPQMLVRMFAGMAAEQQDEVRPSPMGGSNLVTRGPLGVVAAMVHAHRSAQSAADLAALAAADAVGSGRDACTAAGTIAGANGALLTGCALEGRDVVVDVTVPGPHWLGQVADLSAEARAGPA